MALDSGSRLGPYEVTALIGVGGMGEVYRARDTTLGRDVAIKILPTVFSSDAMRVMRFEQEARTLASLNHSNIAHIYGLERSAGDTGIVMELVDGPTLMERIAQGPLPVEEALKIAGQLADALEAAHERGIVHRDLKPANIKLKPDGTVKVLDFGIAKALDANATGASPATQTGVVLGTPAYMSPEQARGKSVDKRADVWAFGCLLYEMLSGRRVFEDDDTTLTAASLRESSATVDGLATVPPAVRRTIKLCLEPDVRKRLRDIGDARLALEGAFETSESLSTTGPTRGRWLRLTGFAVAGLALIALAIPALRHLREAPPPETRTDIVTPSTNSPESFALSPDGQQIVFVASGQLWLRSLATGTERPLSGTEGAWLPFWRPNSRSIGFFADGWLKRLDLDGGVPQPLVQADNGSGGAWNADDLIVFAPTLTSSLMRISASGGEATPVVTLRPGQYSLTNPSFLPDGSRFLFHSQGSLDGAGVYIGALDGSVSRRLTPSGSDARHLPTGWMLWVRDGGALVAQRLDLAKSVLTGELLTLAPGVSIDNWRHAAVSVSSNGQVAYRAPGGSQRQLTWFDRFGIKQGTLGDADSAALEDPRVTPDGRSALVTRLDQGNYDLWQVDDDGRRTRITTDPAGDELPLLSPGGTTIVFRSLRTGSGDLYKKIMGRDDPEELLLHSDEVKSPISWSADGRFLLYMSSGQLADIWVLPMQGDGKEYEFLKTEFREAYPSFSPNGQWVAYQSHVSGSSEVYVKRFFVPGETGSEAAAAQSPISVSRSGGAFPTWRKDGQELYYLNPVGDMMAVPITVTGEALVPGTPQKLFSTRIYRGGRDVQQGRQYEVAADGRFLINTEIDSGVGVPITLIQNWNPDAQR